MDVLKIRLYPDPVQAAKIENTFDCCRFLWNRMLADEEKLLAELGRHFIPAPARYKRESPALKAADSLALNAVHSALERSFRDHAFNPHDYKKPEPLTECSSYTTFCQRTKSGSTVCFTREGLKLPKLGEVKTGPRRELPMGSEIRSAVICREGEDYFCTLALQAGAQAPAAALLEKLPA